MWLFTRCDPEVQISHIFSLLLAGDVRGLFNWLLKAAPLLTNPGSRWSNRAGPPADLVLTHTGWAAAGDTLKLCGL